MVCEPHCRCKCGHSGCECWDGALPLNEKDKMLLEGSTEKGTG